MAKLLNKNDLDNNCLIAHLPIKIDNSNNNNNNNDNTEKLNDKLSLFLNTEKNNDNNYEEKKKLLKKINELENHILKLENNNQKKLYFNYSSTNIANKIEKKDNLCCWWCSHRFNNNPVYLPNNKTNNEYHVYGYFCSFNCAMAYNIDLDDYKVNERSYYLNLLYYDLNKTFIKIKPAPSKYCLDIYGGEIDIDTYRNNFLNSNNDYTLLTSPLKSIIPVIEIGQNVDYYKNNKPTNINNKLTIKRKKPLKKNNNSIELAMNLKLCN